ncbi:hypothetical protein AAY81_04995 [Denitrobacterium detoxificans]|uniref:Uncharacterized protein n=1 Tax=Denitrobacterium detoxificans TaxID=79604 RepID=A0A172RW65_9ACTN|nr:hypothetical protein [Denitrobacterium detoxificans]ANE21962.1 hypothetical protein AAY81_00915 [Denitrobacterium detoxificans]ANE22586.1 hypothetical protein AAY81_04995 [Denitrobacterium detoxificans]SEP03668.1 hypothetical protein SAMN02910314_01990 [Denitrobacterium detoxificans]
MTNEDVISILESTGYPVSYGVPSDEESLPRIVVYESASSDLRADQTIYQRIRSFTAELWTAGKQPAQQRALEDALLAAGLVPTCMEMPLADEKLIRTDYEFSTLLD